MHVSDEYSELGQELKNGLVIDPPPGFVKNSKTWRLCIIRCNCSVFPYKIYYKPMEFPWENIWEFP